MYVLFCCLFDYLWWCAMFEILVPPLCKKCMGSVKVTLVS